LQRFKLIYTRQTNSHLPIANKQTGKLPTQQERQNHQTKPPKNTPKTYSYNTNQKSKSWMQKLKEQVF
jgi:hypothetical protein